ncbi:MAG: hypothetical protein K5871_09380 [Lachnospiraceae bacterium]|nr:hypothetical protein [Lachnospiraceae bacterium]
MNNPLPHNTVRPISVTCAKLLPAECPVDLGDGSERGEYVEQDYVLSRLRRPMRAINLMYCYYPLDKEWPKRASFVTAQKGGESPYDDYFPYSGGLTAKRRHSSGPDVFECMKDIRRHGEDVILTITIDPKVSDDHLTSIARDLRPFGRIMVRINHEATGTWFSFNKRATYEELGQFFAHCCEIFHKEAPQAKIILCLDGYTSLKAEQMVREDEFTPAIKAADIVSVDRYLSLHWGWPGDIAEKGGKNFKSFGARNVYALAKKSSERYDMICGKHKPMVLSELNADGDVNGPYDQCRMLKTFCGMIKNDRDKWLSGFTLYQFRDRGRLGLEIQDPNNENVGIEQPLMKTFREIISDPYFSPAICKGKSVRLGKNGSPASPVTMRWGGSEDSEGIALTYEVNGSPVFCECYFEDNLTDASLMLETNGSWFHKAPGTRFVDLMPAFFDMPRAKYDRITIHMFMTPSEGTNDPSKGKSSGKDPEDDWAVNQYYQIRTLPVVRIETEKP